MAQQRNARPRFEIGNNDLWSAIRGLDMGAMDCTTLDKLISDHAALAESMFASAVIYEAARQYKAMRRNMRPR